MLPLLAHWCIQWLDFLGQKASIAEANLDLFPEGFFLLFDVSSGKFYVKCKYIVPSL